MKRLSEIQTAFSYFQESGNRTLINRVIGIVGKNFLGIFLL